MDTQVRKSRAKVTTQGDREVRIERTFDAPLDRVWQAYTDPALLSQWWGRGNPLTVERYEFEVGGHWRFVEHGDDDDHGFEGRFREVEAPEHLSLTFEWDGMPGHVSVTTSEFEDLGDHRTMVTSTMLFLTAEDRDGMLGSGMEQGMEESYAALDAVLARTR